MGDRLKELREKSLKRRKLLAPLYGVSSPDELKTVLKTGEDHEEKKNIQSMSSHGDAPVTKKQVEEKRPEESVAPPVWQPENNKEDTAEKDDFDTEEMYKDSSTFLKGLQSANPHNDYCQNHVDSGERPQNFIRDVGLANRFEEYPKLRELIRLKDELISNTNSPPMYYNCDLEMFDLRELRCKFDVILVEPPLEEYQRTKGVVFDRSWDWDEIERLDVPAIAAQRSFIWIWCGNAEGLERGRQCLKRWGFRRCEDICWIKTNIMNPGHNKNLEPNAIFQRTKEHCLMGIKGTVKRSTDGDFIHANVDIDLIIEEEPEYACKDKPVEIFHIIEHFCLGRRRIHLFARDSTIRPGWLSIGTEVTNSNFDPDSYSNLFPDEQSHVTGCSDEIERLRPKSPQPKNKSNNPSDRGKGPGRGAGGRGGLQRGGRGGNMRGGHRGRGAMGRGMGRGGFKPRNSR